MMIYSNYFVRSPILFHFMCKVGLVAIMCSIKCYHLLLISQTM